MPGPRFCPQCAGPLASRRLRPDEPERRVCAECGRVEYENARPCAGVVIVREGRVLLSRRAVPPCRGCWDLPGGFLEAWEHPGDGARREAREELGVAVELGPQLGIFMDVYDTPDGPLHTLNVYYLVERFAGEPRPDDDVAALEWFRPDEIPHNLAFRHLRDVLDAWRAVAGAPLEAR